MIKILTKNEPEANFTKYVLSNGGFSEYNQKKTLNLSITTIEQDVCLDELATNK